MRSGGAASARLGGGVAIVLSFVLVVVMLARDVDFNVLNVWTIVGSALGGFAATVNARSRHASAALIVVAALPALPGGVGWIFAVPVILLLLGRGRDVGGGFEDRTPRFGVPSRRG